ncbi:MAG: NAD(P)/FAD-dependent oxidoreductase [Candidatus Nanopelagicales bacterium]
MKGLVGSFTSAIPMNLYSNTPTDRAIDAVANIQHFPYWQTTIDPYVTPEIDPYHQSDVLIIGGGFTGLWTAVQLSQRFGNLQITLVDKSSLASEASSRNGGFIHQTLTHGFENSLHHWPAETEKLIDLGRINFQELRNFIIEQKIECDWHDAGELEIALNESQISSLKEQVLKANSLNLDWQFLNFDELQERIHNPKFLAASFDPTGVATLNPAKLAHGLIRYLEQRGMKLYQNIEIKEIRTDNDTCLSKHANGVIRSGNVIVATGAHFFAHSLTKMRTVPIYDYSIVSRVLKDEELAKLGWSNREGVIDTGNQFHYYRLTSDNRILWGGYAANYHYGNTIDEALTYQQKEFIQLAEDFFELFEELTDLQFEYGWGGVIDTSSNFVPFFQKSHKGKVIQAAGFTGLGVASSRFAADVILDLLFDQNTARTSLKFVQKKPLPFPPEPLRSLSIWLTRKSLIKEDLTGKRNLWLKLLDRLGVGFDS